MSLIRCCWDVEEQELIFMMKKENPRSRKRHAMSVLLMEKEVSMHTQAEITECMLDKTDEEKEELAVCLIEIITTSDSEEEMIERSRLLL